MFNVASATQAASKLIETGVWSVGKLDKIASKAEGKVQTEGVYNLIFPYLHTDFPTRDEMSEMIDLTFKRHDSTNLHNGQGATPGNTQIQPIMKKEMEKPLQEGIKVKISTPIDSIGYGI